jgi:hypothetical protein
MNKKRADPPSIKAAHKFNFRHRTRDITFCLVVDGFAIRPSAEPAPRLWDVWSFSGRFLLARRLVLHGKMMELPPHRFFLNVFSHIYATV